MTDYAVFDGGNVLQHYDSFASAVDGYDNVRPTNHQPNRHRTIMKHINTGGLPFTADWNPLRVETGDSILTHVFGAGWVLKSLSIHVRQTGKGTLTPEIINSDGTPFSLVATSGTEDEVDLTKKGFSYFTVGTSGELNQSGIGYVKLKYTAESEAEGEEAPIMQGCFGVLLEFMYLEDDGECNCVTVPCPTEFPSPECAPSI